MAEKDFKANGQMILVHWPRWQSCLKYGNKSFENFLRKMVEKALKAFLSADNETETSFTTKTEV